MKKNNKGFSLVELIVVVLIMGIIAVALAPQVIKWVENSRLAADASAYDELVEEIQVSLAKKTVYGDVKSGNYYEFHFGKDGVKVYTTAYGTDAAANAPTALASTDTAVGATNEFYKAMSEIDPDWATVKTKTSGIEACSPTETSKNYVVAVWKDGTVKRTNAPDAVQD